MALFNRSVITNRGKELISKVMSKKVKMIFTKIEATDFVYQEQVNLNELTVLNNPKQFSLISDVANKNNKVTLHTILNNEKLNNGYSINAIGIYAKEENGVEVLFSVLVASEADFIPAKQGNNLTTINYDLVYTIDNSEKITIIVENAALATAEMMNKEREERIAADENLKNIANSKEPAINKKTGFNLDKTDLTENNSNKLFTAKGALDLFNKLTSTISTKVSITDAWRFKDKPIGNTQTNTDLNTITEVGRYYSASNSYLFTNKPADISGAFLLEVESIQPNGETYITQTIKSYSSNTIYRRFTSNGTSNWFGWRRIDGNDKVSKSGDVMNGDLTVSGNILVKAWGKKIIASYNHGYSLYDANLNSKYLAYIDGNGTIQIGYGTDNTPINFQKAPTILNWNVITEKNFNVGSVYLTNINANEIIKTGTYGIHSTYATVANNIPYQAWGFLETKVSLNNGNDVVQEFTTIEGSKSYRRYRNNGNWSSWVSLKDYLPLTGGILTGNVVINNTKPYLEFKINGTRHMLIGITNSNNNDVVWSASNYGTNIVLKSDRVYTNRNIYINNDRVATESWVAANRTWGNLTGKPAFNNTVTSTSTTEIATPNAVKTAYDRGSAAMTEANKKLPLTGGTISGNLTVTGTILANGNITAFSDRRLKKDIHKIENALEKIKNVSGYTFTMNGEKRTGVIAQEIQKVLPEIVSKQTFEDKEYLAVAYGNMAGLFIEAIKELKNEIEVLKKKAGD